jgi:hypothetical protein
MSLLVCKLVIIAILFIDLGFIAKFLLVVCNYN